MARNHKDHDLGLEVITELDDGQLASICETAAAEAKGDFLSMSSIRLESSTQGRLIYSVRGPGGFVELMTFDVRVGAGDYPETDDADSVVRTHILSYKTKQSVVGGFIPVGPKRMLGLSNYKSFNSLVASGISAVDPTAQADENFRGRT